MDGRGRGTLRAIQLAGKEGSYDESHVNTEAHCARGAFWMAGRNEANGVPDKITLVDWAYESDPGLPIHAGSIPEPSSLALLAAGAAGIAAFRKRRRA